MLKNISVIQSTIQPPANGPCFLQDCLESDRTGMRQADRQLLCVALPFELYTKKPVLLSCCSEWQPLTQEHHIGVTDARISAGGCVLYWIEDLKDNLLKEATASINQPIRSINSI